VVFGWYRVVSDVRIASEVFSPGLLIVRTERGGVGRSGRMIDCQ